MKAITIKKMQDRFANKVCTVLTVGIAKQNFQDTQYADFFTGMIESIDEDGIFTTHTLTHCKNFYAWPHIVGIMEEQALYEDNPEHAKIIQQLKEKKLKQEAAPDLQRKQPAPESPYADVDIMAQLSQQAKELQKKMVQKQ